MKKTMFVLLAALMLVGLTGCGSHVKYDGSGYFTSADESFQIEYNENFKQQKKTPENYMTLEWKKQEISFQIARQSKDLEVITSNYVVTLDGFISLYRERALSFLEPTSEFGELKDAEGFDQFTNARIQNVTTTERNDIVESFLIYGETDTDYYVIYAVGDDMSFLAHYDELYQYAQTLKPQ